VDHPEEEEVVTEEVVEEEVVAEAHPEVEEAVLEVAEEVLVQERKCLCNLTRDSRECTSCVERTMPS
jgi:hypothetical protein